MALNVNHRAQGSSKSQVSIQPADSLNDVDSQINRWLTLASTLPFRHPDRAVIAHNIASFRRFRYEATRQKGDLDQAIGGYVEALLRGMNHPPLDVLTFEHLTRALLTRFNDFGAREDLDHSISYFRHLSNLPLEVTGIKRLNVLKSLAIALLSKFEVGGRPEDIEDAISLLRHVITMTPPGTDDYRLIAGNLADAWRGKYDQTGESEDLTETISHYRAVLTSCPLGHPLRPLCLRNLAYMLALRSQQGDDLSDVKNAASLYQELLDLLDKEDPDRMWVLMSLANVYHTRFQQTGHSEDLEIAISQGREVLLLCPPGHENKGALLINLGFSLISRFENFGRMDCLEEGISLYRAALRLCPRDHPHRQQSLSGLADAIHWRCLRTHSIEDLEESINLEHETLALTPPGHPMRPQMLHNLSVSLETQYKWTGDMGYIEEAIEHLYEASKLVKSGHPGDSRHILQLLARNLVRRFRHRGADKDAADAIKHYRTSISSIPEGHVEVSSMLSNFAIDLRSIFSLTGDAEHLEESIVLSRSAVEYPFSSVRDRLIAANNWTLTARSTRHSSALTAYRKALSLLQRAIDLGPTVQNRHEYISGRRIEPIRSLPMDAASYAIESRAYEEATEMLEQGRALLWSGMRSLRTPLDHLHQVDNALADEFTEISQALEAIITTTHVRDFVQTPVGTDDDGVAIGRKDTFARDLAEKRRLSGELDNVVLRIQALPDSRTSGDPSLFLSETRKSYRLESKKYDRVLRQTLEELSELVALIASRSGNLSGSASGQPSLLIVGQPDESLPGVDSETRSIECLVGSGSVTRIAGEAATPENVIAHLPMHPWVHFACHGMLQPGRPFESSFLLQDKTHLTLLRIAKSHLPTAELAFLAVCHTAELTEDGAPDEVLHLTAAMQFSGFRSVIGTMWAMVDEDGEDLSEHFYSKMFAAGAQVAIYEKSAMALRHATQKLRTEKGVSLERWVNFVHYGA
ncbi:CHAT domain-containing protein [Lactifluus subvellereus]|nr:CHAT domain-containing protein [Lactifluus subvellereus]